MLKCAVKRQAGLRAMRKTPLGKEIDAGARGPPSWQTAGTGHSREVGRSHLWTASLLSPPITTPLLASGEGAPQPEKLGVREPSP